MLNDSAQCLIIPNFFAVVFSCSLGCGIKNQAELGGKKEGLGSWTVRLN